MKKLFCIFLMISIYISLIAFPCLAATSPSDYWQFETFGGAAATAAVVSDVKFKGRASVKVENKSAKASNTYAVLSAGVSAIANTTYKYSFWIRTKELSDGFYFSHDNLQTLNFIKPVNNLSTWKCISYEFTTSANAASYNNIKFMIDNVGAIWIDEISVQKKNNDGTFEPNIVKNSGFETFGLYSGGYNYDTVLVPGWTVMKPRADMDYDASVVTDVKHSGSSSLKIVNNVSTVPYAFLRVFQNVPMPLNDGKTYKYTFWIKSENQSNPVSCSPNGNNNPYKALPVFGTHDWTQISFECTNSSWSDTSFHLTSENTGVLWIDDVSVQVKNGDTYGNNLVNNPGFEEAGSQTDILYSQFNNIKIQKIPKLDSMLQECEKFGIPVDYEQVNRSVIGNFAEYGIGDVLNGKVTRAEYVLQCIEELYNKAEAALISNISGLGKPLSVPRYKTGDVTIDGYGFKGNTTQSGVETVQPILFTGYNTMGSVGEAVENLDGFGVNLMQNDMYSSPKNMIIPTEDTGWMLERFNNPVGETGADCNRVASGTTAATISCSSNQDYVGISLAQIIAVEPNTKYIFTAKATGENVTWPSVYFGSTEHRKYFVSGTYDWTEFTYEYTTGSDETSFTYRLCADRPIDKLWFDDLTMVKEGTNVNLLVNGGFESGVPVTSEIGVSLSSVANLVSALKKAEANNLRIDVLMSLHYFPEWLKTRYPDIASSQASTCFLNFNIFHPKVNEALNISIKYLTSSIKEFKSVNSICISNEPTYNTSKCFTLGSDSYGLAAKWQAYLQSVYGSISSLNSAYGMNWPFKYSSFASVPMPSAVAKNVKYYDYMIFNNIILSDWHKGLAQAVHAVMPGIPVHSKIMDGMLTAERGVNSLEWGSEPEYFAQFSDVHGNDSSNYIARPVATITDKIKWYDLLSSLKKMPVYNSEDHIIFDEDTQYIPQQVNHWVSDMWQGAIHRRSASTAWFWERNYDDTNATSRSVKCRPDVVAGMGKTSLDLNRLSGEVKALADEQAEVAILYSIPSRLYMQNAYINSVDKIYKGIIYNGEKAAFISEKQLAAHEFGNLKAIIIPVANNVLPSTVDSLKYFIDNGGKVMIFGNSSLGKNQGNSSNDAATLSSVTTRSTVIPVTLNSDSSDITSPTQASIKTSIAGLLGQIGTNGITVIDNATGVEVDGTEYTSCVKDGKILVNLCNYEWNTKNISVQYNGQVISNAEDLISNSKVNCNSLEINGFEPVLISSILLDEVQNLTALVQGNAITLSWQYQPTSILQCFSIFRISEDGSEEFVADVNAGELSYTAGGLNIGEEYTFAVKCKNNSGLLTEGVRVTQTPNYVFEFTYSNFNAVAQRIDADVSVKNISNEKRFGCILLSVYDENNALVKYAVVSRYFEAMTTEIINVSLQLSANIPKYSAEVKVLSDLDNKQVLSQIINDKYGWE